jgi:Flp pilus assembly protein TadG
MGLSLLRKRYGRGSAMVETAIVLPILAMLLFAIAEFSIGFLRWQAVTTAAREGAREASLFRRDCPANVNAAINEAINDVLDAARLDGATVSIDGACVSPGSSRVTVSVPYSFVVLPNFTAVSRSINLSATSVMRNSSLIGAGV